MASRRNYDPTRTTMLRRKFVRLLSRKYTDLARIVIDAVVRDNIMGITTNVQFKGDKAEKLSKFQLWLKAQYSPILESASTDAYWETFVAEGYEKGSARAFTDARKTNRALASTSDKVAFYEGTKEQFLAEAFNNPQTVEKVKLLAARTFTDLKGVNDVMSTQMSRVMAEGLSAGTHPNQIARALVDRVDKIGKTRAQTIARTEIIRAHAEGQLDNLERLGVDKVGVMVEWSTAGDDRVCPMCQDLEAVVLSIKEARGILPRHPNCRCTYIPANVGESSTRKVNYTGDADGVTTVRQRKDPKKVRAALKASAKRSKDRWKPPRVSSKRTKAITPATK